MKSELIIVAAVCGAVGAAILLTKFELLAEVIALILKAILKSAWLIFTAVFEIIKSLLEIFVNIVRKIYEILFPTKPPTDNDNSTNT